MKDKATGWFLLFQNTIFFKEKFYATLLNIE